MHLSVKFESEEVSGPLGHTEFTARPNVVANPGDCQISDEHSECFNSPIRRPHRMSEFTEHGAQNRFGLPRDLTQKIMMKRKPSNTSKL